MKWGIVLPTIKFTIEVEANDIIPVLHILVMKSGLKFAMKGYQKPTHTDRYLQFKSNHPHHMKRGDIHSLINQAKDICQDQKDLNDTIKKIRHDLMLNENPQKFIDFPMKPLRSNCPSSDIIYQGTVIIPHIKGTSEKFRHIGNHFNVRTIFKTKHTLHGTLMKTGLVRGAQ
jgi:hypothetical protein